jgi:predicted transcriptional regulator
MKTLTITISDETAEALEQATADGKHTVEQVASHVVESAYTADWGDLDEEDIAAIEEGLADLERGDVVPHEEVVAGVRKKYGW